MARKQIWSKALLLLAVLCELSVCYSESSGFDPWNNPSLVEIFIGEYNNRSALVSERNGKGLSNSVKCMMALKEVTTNYRDPRNLRMFDAWGKIPAGLMSGHLTSLGHFDQCVNIYRYIYDMKSYMRGQYCIANIDMKHFALQKLIDPSANYRPQPKDLMSPNVALSVGICIPDACDPDTVNALLGKLGRLKKNSCATKHRAGDYEPVTIVAIVLFSAIGLFMLISSVWDYLYMEVLESKAVSLPPMLLSVMKIFSVITNGKKLFDIRTTKSSNSIDCLHGLRVISMVWVIFGHNYVFFAQQSLLNPIQVVSWYRNLFSTLMMNATVSVDTFFFLSGFLVGYLMLKEFDKGIKLTNILSMYLHRYLRLTPVLAFAILFTVGLLRHMTSGPFFNVLLALAEPPCQENWWVDMLYVQNYVRPDGMCLGHTWYLAIDMQLYILAPLVLIPLYKWGKKVIPAIVNLCLLSMACVIATFFAYDIANLYLNSDDKMAKTYYPTHTRYSPWLIGVMLGYFFFATKGRKIQLPNIVVWIGWILCYGVMLTILLGTHHLTQAGAHNTVLQAACYEAFSRSGWAIAMAWIVFACHNGHGGLVNSILSYPAWQPLGRLSYCMYISHMLVHIITFGSERGDVNFSDYDVILKFWANFGLTVCVSIVMVLAFESPMIAIEKMIFGKGDQRKVGQRQEQTVGHVSTQKSGSELA